VNPNNIDDTFISQPTPTGTGQLATGGWMVTIEGTSVTFQAVALCYDNP
jgi:hypothetical protein